MKPRRVIVTLEIETDLPIDGLRSKIWWREALRVHDAPAAGAEPRAIVHQVHVNVVRPDRRPKAGGDSTTTVASFGDTP